MTTQSPRASTAYSSYACAYEAAASFPKYDGQEGNKLGEKRSDLQSRTPFGTESYKPYATKEHSTNSSTIKYFPHSPYDVVYASHACSPLTPPFTPEATSTAVKLPRMTPLNQTPFATYRASNLDSPPYHKPYARSPPLDIEWLRHSEDHSHSELAFSLAETQTQCAQYSAPPLNHYLGGTLNPHLNATFTASLNPYDSYDQPYTSYSPENGAQSHAFKLNSINHASIPPPPPSPDIYPTYHPSVVTPSSIPDEFTARLPLLTYNPRGPRTAYANYKNVLSSEQPSTRQTQRQQGRSGRSCTPLSSSRVLFRRSSRPTRPVPRRATLKDRVSPRAHSAEPPASKNHSSPQHNRAASAFLPGKSPQQKKSRCRESDSAAASAQSTTAATISKRPSRVPPLPLGKILQARDVHAGGVGAPLDKHSSQDAFEAARIALREEGYSNVGTRRSHEVVAEETQTFRSVSRPPVEEHVPRPGHKGTGHWHSRQPTLTSVNGGQLNSQSYKFPDIDSTRAASNAAVSGSQYRPEAQARNGSAVTITERGDKGQTSDTESSTSCTSSPRTTFKDASVCCDPRPVKLIVQRTVRIEWNISPPSKSKNASSSRRGSHTASHNVRAPLQRSSLFVVFVDGDKL